MLPRLRMLALCALAVAFSSCAQLNTLLANAAALQAPTVSLKQVALAATPTQRALTAYFCPRVLRERLNLGVASDLICTQAFGGAPSQDALKVAFDIHLSVQNPNRVPVPLSSVLTSINVFPGAQESQLGAACVSLCSSEDARCAAKDRNACPVDATDITQRAEIAQALGKMVIAEGARLATGEPLGVKAPEVLANGALDVVVRLGFDPQQLLPILQRVAGDAASQLRDGKPISLAIPYKLAGNLFTSNMGSAGVLSAPFGPIDGTWQPSP